MRKLRYLMVVGTFAALVVVAAPASAQVSGSDTPITTPTTVEVGGTTEERGTPVEVAGAIEDPGDPGDPAVLSFTGGDVVALVILGAFAVGLGSLFVARARARSGAGAARMS